MGVVRIKPKNSKGEEIIKWRVRYKDPHTSKQVVDSTHDLKKDAEKRWRKVKAQLDEGSYVSKRDAATLGEVAELYADFTRTQLTRVTMVTYDSLLDRYIVPCLGDMKLPDLNRSAVQFFFDGLAAEGLSARTLQKIKGVFYRILAYAVDHEAPVQHVLLAQKVKLPKVKRKKPERPSRKEIGLMLDKTLERTPAHGFQPERTRAILYMGMFAGLRQGEIRALTWSNIQWPEPGEQHGWIHVRQAMDKFGKIKEPKSEAGNRRVPMVPELAKTLRQWKLAQRPNPTDYVFTTKHGGPLNPTAIRCLWQVHLAYCGLTINPQPHVSSHNDWNAKYGKPKYKFHVMRHVAASLWIAHGCNMKTLQTYVGHESISTTMDVYGYLLADDEKQSAAVLKAAEEFLGGPGTLESG